MKNNTINKKDEMLLYKNIWINNINLLMSYNNWTIKNLSDKSNLPYDSVKKLLAGKINNPSLFTMIKVSDAFDCGIDFLMNSNFSNSASLSPIPQRVSTLIKEIADFELYLHNQNNNTLFEEITVLIPTGRFYDGMIFDSFSLTSVDISAYRKNFGDIIMCGLKITSNDLRPIYLCNDVLLIAKDRYPLDNEIGVFLLNNQMYIRRYTNNYPSTLEPIGNNGNPIIISDIDDIHFMGRVLTIIR